MRKIVIVALATWVAFSSCSKNEINNTQTCEYDPCIIKAPATEITQLESYLSGAGITTATKHCSGMYYSIGDPGIGTAPTACSYITMGYKGSLTNGTVFDSTTAATPYSAVLATLITGVVDGVLTLKKAGKVRLYIPPSLGYGAVDKGVIPGNSILIFDIQLLDVQ